MSATVIIALAGMVTGAIGALLGGVSAVRKGGTDKLQLTVTAMQAHIDTISDENKDQRRRLGEQDTRIFDQQGKIADLEIKLLRCEADKSALESRLGTRVDHLERRIDNPPESQSA